MVSPELTSSVSTERGGMSDGGFDVVSDDVRDWRTLRATAEEQAFAALFTRHQRVVYNFCFRRLGSWSHAEDATQATFTTLWRRAREARLDPLAGTSAVPLLLSLAGFECQTLSRTLARRTGLLGRLRVLRGASDAASHAVDDWIESEATMRAIHESLAGLPSGQRDVIELVCWSELSVAEAAEALGIAEGTVKSRLHRARENLAGSPAAALLGESR